MLLCTLKPRSSKFTTDMSQGKKEEPTFLSNSNGVYYFHMWRCSLSHCYLTVWITLVAHTGYTRSRTSISFEDWVVIISNWVFMSHFMISSLLVLNFKVICFSNVHCLRHWALWSEHKEQQHQPSHRSVWREVLGCPKGTALWHYFTSETWQQRAQLGWDKLQPHRWDW